MKELIDKLHHTQELTREEFLTLLSNRNTETDLYARRLARGVRQKIYGDQVYIRGSDRIYKLLQKRLLLLRFKKEQSCRPALPSDRRGYPFLLSQGYELGFRTFVLQGGEDGYFTGERLAGLVRHIKKQYPDCALTLSVGERTEEEYRAFWKAGADRYLLRHETADETHYRILHPEPLSLQHRKDCLRTLKKLGFQTGAGFMVGSPGQTAETLAEDFLFLKELDPEMVGIGPFISHKDTPFRSREDGTLEDTLFYLALVRLMLPRALLPATTALGTIAPDGRELGILSGANVVMPNLSPLSVRKKYMLYDGKISTGDEAAECVEQLRKRMETIGCCIVTDRGDYKK